MAIFSDGRIPVVFGVTPLPGDGVLRAEAGWVAAHPAGCGCCAARGPAAVALDRMFLDRVQGRVAWFGRVVVVGDGEAVRQAVVGDAVVGSRFRLG